MINSKLILGSAQFGMSYGINNLYGKPNKLQINEILNFARSKGVKYIDTAEGYGSAEKNLGKYNIDNFNSFKFNTKFKKQKNSLKKQLSKTLKLLNIKQIETYFFHNYEDFYQNSKIFEELIDLKNEKLIKNIGISIYDNKEFKSAIEHEQIDVIQTPYNLLDNYSKRGNLIKKSKYLGKKIQARSLFLQGLFFKPLKFLNKQFDPLKPYLKTINEYSIEYQISIESICLQYAMKNDLIDYFIIGVESLEQLKNNLNCLSKELPNEVFEYINDLRVIQEDLLLPKNWK